METGTVEPPVTPEESKKKRRVPATLAGRGGSGRGGGGGGSDDGPEEGGPGGPNQREAMPEETNPEKSKILTWFLLLVVLMTFGGLIGAYVVIATNGALEWRPFSLPVQVWVSTAIILASSLTYHFGKSRLNAVLKPESAKKWFLATTVLGAAFISSQILAWMALVERGLYMRGNPYAGFFYILTAVHAVHVIGGIVALGYIVLRTWDDGRLPESERTKNRTEAGSVGLYWHTMDGLWLLLLFLLGFWK